MKSLAVVALAGAIVLAPRPAAADSTQAIAACNALADIVRTIAANRDAGVSADNQRAAIDRANLSDDARNAMRAEITLVYGATVATPDQLAAGALAGCLERTGDEN